MDKLTGGQTGGAPIMVKDKSNPTGDAYSIPEENFDDELHILAGGGRRRKSHRGHKGNSWLAHVKATMKLHPGKSFKQVLKIAKKTYKRSQSQSSSQSQSQSGGKRRKSNGKGKGKGKGTRKGQYGGSGVAEYATPV